MLLSCVYLALTHQALPQGGRQYKVCDIGWKCVHGTLGVDQRAVNMKVHVDFANVRHALQFCRQPNKCVETADYINLKIFTFVI